MRQVANSSCLLPSTMESMETGDADRDLNDTQSRADVLLRTYEVLPHDLPNYIRTFCKNLEANAYENGKKEKKIGTSIRINYSFHFRVQPVRTIKLFKMLHPNGQVVSREKTTHSFFPVCTLPVPCGLFLILHLSLQFQCVIEVCDI